MGGTVYQCIRINDVNRKHVGQNFPISSNNEEGIFQLASAYFDERRNFSTVFRWAGMIQNERAANLYIHSVALAVGTADAAIQKFIKLVMPTNPNISLRGKRVNLQVLFLLSLTWMFSVGLFSCGFCVPSNLHDVLLNGYPEGLLYLCLFLGWLPVYVVWPVFMWCALLLSCLPVHAVCPKFRITTSLCAVPCVLDDSLFMNCALLFRITTCLCAVPYV